MATLEITTRIGCAVACAYCPQDLLLTAYPSGSPRLMSLSTFRTCVARTPRTVDIHFTGYCEPWLNPDATAMVEYAHGLGHRLHVATTLVGMRPEDVRRLAALPFKVLAVHLPSAEAAEHIAVTPTYLEVLSRLMGAGVVTGFHYHGHSIHPALEAFGLGAHRRISHDRAGNISGPGVRCVPRRRGKLVCERIHRNVLLPNGEVALCCMDYGLRHRLGSLLEGDYESLFRSAEHRRVIRGLREGEADVLCRSCPEAADSDLRAKLLNGAIPTLRRRVALLRRNPRELLARWMRRARREPGR